jgi:hypothetical protein
MTQLATKKQSNPWERRENESSRAYGAFCLYRDMGVSRNQVKVAELSNRSPALMYKWSRKHNWTDRAEAYDLYLDERQREFTENARLDRALRHADLGRLMQDVGRKKLKSKRFVKRIAPREVIGLIKTGTDVEREALGDSREKQHGNTNIQVNVLGGIESAVTAAREVIVRELLAAMAVPGPLVIESSDVPTVSNSGLDGTGCIEPCS